jgi:hypothetical protein
MRVVQLFVLVLVSGITIAQEAKVPAIVKRLQYEPRPVKVFSSTINKYIATDDLPETFNNAGQEITKSSKGIFLNQLGTGRIYKLSSTEGEFEWKRIDSTIFIGYNFFSLFFSMDSTLYSFSGQGFFQQNGTLRYFNEESKEWDARELSASILWVSQSGLFYSIDTTNKLLYIEAFPLKQDQTLKNKLDSEIEDTFWKLDMRSGDWTKLGKLNKEKLVSMAETPFGTLYNFYKIADLKNNKLYKLSPELSNRIRNKLGSSTRSQNLALSYCIDSTLYMGDLNNFIDSVVISKKDLIDTGEIFYTPIEVELPIKEREILIGLVIMLGLTSSFLFYKNKSKSSNQPPVLITGINQSESILGERNHKENQVVFRSGKLMDLLNEREKTLLSFIYEHSLDERLTTIEEINKVIGAAQRNSEVQKRLRSDLIGTINDKLEIVAESKHNVIDKQRSEFDKRSFEYFIRPEHMQLVEKVLGKKA